MRYLLGVGDDAHCSFDDAGTGWLVGWIGQRRIGFEALAQDHLGREPVEHTLSPAVVGRVEAAQHDLQIAVAVERDAQYFLLHTAVEALDHAVGLWRVGARLGMLHTVPLAGSLERIGCEAGAAVGQHMRDLERKSTERLCEEGHG